MATDETLGLLDALHSASVEKNLLEESQDPLSGGRHVDADIGRSRDDEGGYDWATRRRKPMSW